MSNTLKRMQIAMKSPQAVPTSDTRPRCEECHTPLTSNDLRSFWDGQDPVWLATKGVNTIPRICNECVDRAEVEDRRKK